MGITNKKLKNIILKELYSIFPYRGQAEQFSIAHSTWECIQYLQENKEDTAFSGVTQYMSGKRIYDKITQKEKLKILGELG